MKISVCLLIVVLAPTLSWAALRGGGQEGGGGGAFVCRLADGSIRESELLDLWEGIEIDGLTIPRSNDPVQGQIDRALNRLAEIDPEFASIVAAEVSHVQNRIEPLPPGIAIAPPRDANNWYVKKGCSLEGMMVYDDTAEKLKIDTEIFSKLLSNSDVAGAYLHEAIYKHYRKMKNADTSIESRRLTACLLSNSDCLKPLPFDTALKDMAATSGGQLEHCTWSTVETIGNPVVSIEYYQREYSWRLQHPEILFKTILGRTFQNAAFGSIAKTPIGPGSNVRLGAVSIKGLEAFGYQPYALQFFYNAGNPDRIESGQLRIRDNDHPEQYTFGDGFRDLIDPQCAIEPIP